MAAMLRRLPALAALAGICAELLGHRAFTRLVRRDVEALSDPVRVGPDTDVVDVAVLMSDYNLITIPVVDERRRMIGIITVDDVLETTLPDDWRRRQTAQPPDAHAGNGP